MFHSMVAVIQHYSCFCLHLLPLCFIGSYTPLPPCPCLSSVILQFRVDLRQTLFDHSLPHFVPLKLKLQGLPFAQ